MAASRTSWEVSCPVLGIHEQGLHGASIEGTALRSSGVLKGCLLEPSMVAATGEQERSREGSRDAGALVVRAGDEGRQWGVGLGC